MRQNQLRSTDLPIDVWESIKEKKSNSLYHMGSRAMNYALGTGDVTLPFDERAMGCDLNHDKEVITMPSNVMAEDFRSHVTYVAALSKVKDHNKSDKNNPATPSTSPSLNSLSTAKDNVSKVRS